MIRLDDAPVLASIINCIRLIVSVRRERHVLPRPPAPMTDAERAAALDAAAAALHDGPLAWRTSIVDLMKALRLDSSRENRRVLAHELGYTGALDTPEMNTWLHAQVMREVAEHTVPVPGMAQA